MISVFKKRGALLALLFAFALVVAACAEDEPATTTTTTPQATTTQPPETATTAAPAPTTTLPPPVPGRTVLACQVSDVGGIDDKSFNASAWAGAQQAAAELEGVSVEFLESGDAADYRPNIDAFIAQGCDVVITVGFLMGNDTAAAAVDNPGQLFAIVDQAPGPFAPWADEDGNLLSESGYANLRGLTFSTDEAGFLAGYMAAGASVTGSVGTFGGLPIPPVTIFMDGFVKGVAHYNSVKGTSVNALGYDSETGEGLFTNNFESLDDGRTFAQTLVDNGADIVLPVAGPVGLGSAALCQETGACLIIGVDADWNETAGEFSDVVLTSILKNIDVSVFNTINNVLVLESVGNTFNGTLANGGVGLAALQDNADRVSAELAQEVADLEAAIVATGGLQAFLDSLVEA